MDEPKIIRKLDAIMEKVEHIERAVYGDEKNKVDGLISLHPKVKSLEDTKKQALWWGSGVLLTLNALWHFLKEKI